MKSGKPSEPKPTKGHVHLLHTTRRTVLWICVGLVLIAGMILAAILISGTEEEEQEEVKEREAARIDSLKRDELERARLETLRLDSIRQDSLLRDSIRKSFRSPDLTFHDLKGPVKRSLFASNREIAYIENPVLEFNRAGKWVNDGWKEDRRIVKQDYPADLNSKIVRDGKGRIIRQKYLGDFEEMCSEDYIWQDDKVVLVRNTENPKLKTVNTYKDGLILEIMKEDTSEAFETIRINQKYTYLDFDEVGNWTRRKVNETIKGKEWGSGKFHKESNTYYETRTITYY